MKKNQCFFGHGAAVSHWILSDRGNIEQYGERVHLCDDCFRELDGLAQTLGYGDGPFNHMMMVTVPGVSYSKTCAVCMFAATIHKFQMPWCKEHYSVAK